MEEILLLNPKGGCGKTTIATQLAAYYALGAHDVVLVDHDIQRSASDWHAARQASQAPIQLFQGSEYPACVNSDWLNRIVIHDMPAACYSLTARQAAFTHKRHILIPILASPTDIKACLRFIMKMKRELVLNEQDSFSIVANRARIHTRYFAVLLAFLERVDIPLIGQLRDTQNYVRVMERGVSVFELPHYRVARDLEQWQSILNCLPHCDLPSPEKSFLAG